MGGLEVVWWERGGEGVRGWEVGVRVPVPGSVSRCLCPRYLGSCRRLCVVVSKGLVGGEAWSGVGGEAGVEEDVRTRTL